eukprot:m.387579 g.387579  ORF g.387579 m.387579 type:complete len:63 (-) comp162886_c0_seq1:97-285(-)
MKRQQLFKLLLRSGTGYFCLTYPLEDVFNTVMHAFTLDCLWLMVLHLTVFVGSYSTHHPISL